MKKQLLILTILFIALTGYAQTVGDTFIDNNITYEITSLTPDIVEVVGYNATNGGLDVVIPATVTPNSSGRTSSRNRMTTYSVTTIGNQSFLNKGITSVIIPDGIISIGTSAFQNNALMSLTIPNSVISISSMAFNNNQLQNLVLGNSLATIGFYAFGINSLPSVDFPDSVTEIDVRAFETNQLTSVTIPSNVVTIGLSAFKFNPLACVTSKATPPPTITTGGINDSFDEIRSNIELTVPTGTTGAYTAAQWTGFNTIEESDFGNMFVVNNITYEITSVSTVSAFNYNTAGGTLVNIPDMVTSACNTYSVTEIAANAFRDNNLTSVTIPDSVIEIGLFAFRDNNQLTSLSIGNNVINIGNEAFFFNNLPSVIIPNSVVSIGDGAFAQNNNMVTVTLGNNVQTIGEYAFRFNNLNSVTIPDSVTTIDSYAFSDNNIFVLDLGNGVETIGERAFLNSPIENVIIPDSVLTIGDVAFFNNSNRNSITLGNSLTSIGEAAFISATSSAITSITIPASVTNIGLNTFAIISLTDVTSLALTPPIITTGANDTFGGISNRSTIHLHIPAGTMGAYVTDTGALWTDFNPVTEDALNVSDFELDNLVKIITTLETLEIQVPNSIQLQNYTLYSITGAKIGVGNTNEINTSAFSNGIYILKLDFDKGSTTRKVVIK